MSHYELKLTDEQWSAVEPILSKVKRETRGRKRKNDKELFEAALYMFANRNTSWRYLTSRGYPPHQSCYRQFLEWDSRHVLLPAIEALAVDLEERGGVPLRECFMDNLFDDHPAGEPVIIVDGGSFWIGDPPPKPWREATKEYFESPRTWIMFYYSQSEWVRSRIPSNLYKRIQTVA